MNELYWYSVVYVKPFNNVTVITGTYVMSPGVTKEEVEAAVIAAIWKSNPESKGAPQFSVSVARVPQSSIDLCATRSKS